MKKGQGKKSTMQQSGSYAQNIEMYWEDMNREQRRAYKSKKSGKYKGMSKPTDNGLLNSSRRTGKVGK